MSGYISTSNAVKRMFPLCDSNLMLRIHQFKTVYSGGDEALIANIRQAWVAPAAQRAVGEYLEKQGAANAPQRRTGAPRGRVVRRKR